MQAKEDFISRIPGMRSKARIEENLRAAEVELTADEFASLEAELGKLEIHGTRTDEDIAKLRQ